MREAASQKMREQAEAAPTWKLLVGFCLLLYVCFELYQWYSTGQLQECARFSIPHCHLITHNSAPREFDFVATMALLGVFIFGPGCAIILYYKLTNRK